MTRQALTYVELDIPYCSLVYGTAPCTASVPTTGPAKCFNTKFTCQDTDHYTASTVTLRFATDTGFNPVEIEADPCLESVAITPGRISLGEDLGQRTSVRFTLTDQKHSDTGPGFDKYAAGRGYDPYARGSFWPRFKARQPYLRGSAIRLIRGFVGQALADMETRHYIVESFDGPGMDGRYTIVAKDMLKLLDGDRAQAPVLNSGYLGSPITSSSTSLTLLPVGVGNLEYAASGKVAIAGNEIASFTRDALAGNDSNTKLLLHFDGTDASTTVTDSAGTPKTATANGNAQLDTADKVFGTASLLLDGTGDYVSFADHADFTFGTAGTIDCRIKLAALPTLSTICSHATDANNQYRLTVSSTGAIGFEVKSASSTIITLASANGVIVSGTWYHIELVKNGNDWTIYVDGVSVATVTDADAVPNFTSTFKVGADGGTTNYLNGWIDELRLSNVARHTAGFTPPVAPYDTSADKLTLTARGLDGTTADDHAANDRVQQCLTYSAEDPAAIIADLMITYGGMDSGAVPLADWLDETDAYNGQVYSAVIAEPTSVKTLISELLLQASLAVWWDDVTAQIRLQVLRAISTDAAVFNDASDKLDGSLTITEQPDQRLSQVWTLFGQRNPLGNDDPSNYRSNEGLINASAEVNYGVPAIYKIASRWIPFGGRAVAARLNQLQLGRFLTPPRRFGFDVFRSEGGVVPVLGGGYQIEAYPLQLADGSPDTVPIQVTRLRPEPDRWVIEAEEMRFSDLAGSSAARTVIYDSNTVARTMRTDHDAIYGAPAHGDTVTFIVNAGVTIGSTSTAVAALTAGTWLTVVRSGNRTSGSPIITGLSSTTEFRAGQRVTGTGMPAGTKILTVDSGSQVTLDHNASSGAGTSTSLTFYTVIVQLQVNGDITGAGGKGGTGRNESSGYVNPTAGERGGPALYTRYPIDIVYGAAARVRCGGSGGGGSATGDGNDLRGGGGGGGAGIPPGAGGNGPGSAENGHAGTETTYGNGGRAWTKNLSFEFATLSDTIKGGRGGSLGDVGRDGSDQYSHQGASNGPLGYAYDGASYILSTGTPAALLGSQVN